MKLNFIKLFLIVLLLTPGFNALAQNSKTSSVSKKQYPELFTISKSDFDNLFAKKEKAVLKTKDNKYLDKSVVLKNVLNGDMKFLRLKLNYFTNAFLSVQVNGTASTQVFLLSTDKSVSYKGKMDNGSVIMTKCEEDEIVSE